MTVQEQYEQLEDTIRTYNPSANFERIHDAFLFADMAHRGQKRKSGEPYIIHPLAVAQILAQELRLDSESIEAALLHDVIEDTPATHAELARRFSPAVADLVEGVSKLTRSQYEAQEEEQQMEDFRKMLFATNKDVRVILIKIADRLHNMRTMDYQSPAKQRQKSLETMEIYAPVAHRLGMQRFKWELEDLSLKYLDPIGYQEIMEKTQMDRPRYEVMIEQTCAQIHHRLEELHLPHRVSGRMKHIYSIYRKMFLQHKTLEEIFDLIAFRVIVDGTTTDCYNVLGVIHDAYKPMPGRFRDYIGTPKPNGYQSLHTTVVGDRAVTFEVQIRTEEMNEVAEYGVAAHWKYKHDGQGDGTESYYEWLRRLLENQDGADAEDYMHSLKVDLFDDKVFVFTPQGDLRSLPAGATPIDFAYAIHSDVGNQMTGAKVNHRLVPLDTVLHNGNIVEIVTSKSSKGPNREWLRIAKSSEARSKIRQWFKKNCKDDNIANGRSAFESELRRMHMHIRDVADPEIMNVLLRNTPFLTLEDLYAAIGYGGFTAQKAVMRIEGELKRMEKQKQAEEAGESAEPPKKEPKSVCEQGIVVEGLDNCLIKFARCCSPVPGDEVEGFITRGYGISVHRADCPNASAQRRALAPDRWIKLSWGKDTNESYPTALEAVCKDRNSLAKDITAAISDAKTNLWGFHIDAKEDGFAVCHVNLRVRDADELEHIMRKLYQVSGVLSVSRPAG